jgi:hypothetical protein
MSRADSTSDQKTEHPNLWARIGPWFLGWVPATGGVLALALTLWNPQLEVFRALALPGCYVASLALSVVAHELGHLAFASWLKLNPYAVRIGHGPRLFRRKILGVTWTFKALPSSGDVKVLPDDPKWIVSRMVCMTAAGPAVSCVLFAVTVWMLFGDSSPLNIHGNYHNWGLFLMPMLYVNAGAFLFSIWPRSFSLEGQQMHNDGLIILDLLRRRDAFVAQLKNQLIPEAEAANGMGWSQLIDAGQTTATLEAWKKHLEEEEMPDRMRHQMLDAFATLVLMSGAVEFLPEADRYSQELHQAKGDEWTVKGTRGSVLIECGNFTEGGEMLRAVMASQTTDFDKAISASFLALAALRQGLTGEAAKWLGIAKKHDPHCASLRRLEALLENGENRQSSDQVNGLPNQHL